MLTYLVLFSFAVVVSFSATWVVRQVATARGWAMAAVSNRTIHVTPVPRLGGVAIYLACAASFSLLMVLLRLGWTRAELRPGQILVVFAPATLAMLLGMLDDFHGLKPWTKLTLEILAGCVLYAGGVRFTQVPALFGRFLHDANLNQAIALLLTVFWVVWITNAFNLIDGIDGLAAGSALFSVFTLFTLALISGYRQVGILAVVLAGSILGFLRFNFNPATIFLGDCGSLFIGFMLAGTSLLAAEKTTILVTVSLPVVAFGLPLVDTVLAVLRRFMSGKPLFGADREHIHHKLLARGLTQRQVVMILYGVSAAGALLSLFLVLPGQAPIGMVLLVIGSGIYLGLQRLGYHELFEIGRVAQRVLEQRDVIRNNLSIRRVTEQLTAARDFECVCNLLCGAFADNDFDTFELEVKLAPGSVSSLPPLTPEGAGCYRYGWRKDSSAGSMAWRLELDLLVAELDGCTASLIVGREARDRALAADINLLTGDFRTSLARAVDRACNPRIVEETIRSEAARAN